MIITSPYPELDIPNVSLPDLILQRAAMFGDDPALIDSDTDAILTYADLAQNIRQVALGLHQLGVVPGDVLCIFSPNTLTYPILYYAILAVGGIVVASNPRYTAKELRHQLEDARVRFLFADPEVLSVAQTAAEDTTLQQIFAIETITDLPFLPDRDFDQSMLPSIDVDAAEDVAVIAYSSGTTGLPKGVMLTHQNLIATILQREVVVKHGRQGVLAGFLPFYHIYGMAIVLNKSLYEGCRIIVIRRYRLERFLALIERYRITYAHLVPPVVVAMTKSPLLDQYDLSSMWSASTGGAPLGPDIQARFTERTGCAIRQGFGMTETTGTGITSSAKQPVRLGSIGQPVPNSECMIVDPVTEQPVLKGERGELWLRGPHIMKAYLNRPDATARALVHGHWLRTGDIVTVDEDGYFYVVDRLKELIKYNGFQVPPAELEALLLTHPKVEDAAVIGIPDEDVGELPKAFVVCKDQEEVSAERLIDFVASQVAPHKKIRLLTFVDSIPKSPSGKILRRMLRG